MADTQEKKRDRKNKRLPMGYTAAVNQIKTHMDTLLKMKSNLCKNKSFTCKNEAGEDVVVNKKALGSYKTGLFNLIKKILHQAWNRVGEEAVSESVDLSDNELTVLQVKRLLKKYKPKAVQKPLYDYLVAQTREILGDSHEDDWVISRPRASREGPVAFIVPTYPITLIFAASRYAMMQDPSLNRDLPSNNYIVLTDLFRDHLARPLGDKLSDMAATKVVSRKTENGRQVDVDVLDSKGNKTYHLYMDGDDPLYLWNKKVITIQSLFTSKSDVFDDRIKRLKLKSAEAYESNAEFLRTLQEIADRFSSLKTELDRATRPAQE